MTVLNAQNAVFTISNITVNGITAFTGFDGVASDIDITTLASTAKEFRQGLQEFGKFSMNLQRDPNDNGQRELFIAMAAQSSRGCVLTLASGDTATFTAYVKSVTSDGAVDKTLTGKCDMKITGAVVWT